MGWGPKAPDMSGANEAARTGAAISKEEWDYYQEEIAPRALQQMDDQIQIGRNDKVADEFAVFLNAYRSDRNLGIPMHVVEKTNSQITRKALVNQLQRWHTSSDDALLRANVIGANASAIALSFFGFVGFAGDTLEKCVNLILREKVACHGSLLNYEGSEEYRLDGAIWHDHFALPVFLGWRDHSIDLVFQGVRQLLLALLRQQL